MEHTCESPFPPLPRFLVTDAYFTNYPGCCVRICKKSVDGQGCPQWEGCAFSAPPPRSGHTQAFPDLSPSSPEASSPKQGPPAGSTPRHPPHPHPCPQEPAWGSAGPVLRQLHSLRAGSCDGEPGVQSVTLSKCFLVVICRSNSKSAENTRRGHILHPELFISHM